LLAGGVTVFDSVFELSFFIEESFFSTEVVVVWLLLPQLARIKANANKKINFCMPKNLAHES